MQYPTLLKRTGSRSLKTLTHLPGMTKRKKSVSSKRARPVGTGSASGDAWARTNMAARAQNDFWLQMFVDAGKPSGAGANRGARPGRR